MGPHIRDRLKLLANPWAYPGYLLLAWSLIGAWSDVEFVIDKIQAVSSQIHPLLLLVAAIGWFGWLIVRPPASVNRIQGLRRLLHEAADACRIRAKQQSGNETIEEISPFGWADVRLSTFLRMAFRYHVIQQHFAIRNEEREKWKDAGKVFPVDLASADFLERLADSLTPDDIDPGFHLPQTYKQFEKTEAWIPNTRPARKL